MHKSRNTPMIKQTNKQTRKKDGRQKWKQASRSSFEDPAESTLGTYMLYNLLLPIMSSGRETQTKTKKNDNERREEENKVFDYRLRATCWICIIYATKYRFKVNEIEMDRFSGHFGFINVCVCGSTAAICVIVVAVDVNSIRFIIPHLLHLNGFSWSLDKLKPEQQSQQQ